MSKNNNQIEARLWDAADELRANSKLKSSEYSIPVLGLIFLRYADQRFSAAEAELAGKGTGRRRIGPADYQARGVLYLPDGARFSSLLQLPEGANIGQAINDSMRAIEAQNPDLKDVLPKTGLLPDWTAHSMELARCWREPGRGNRRAEISVGFT